jgi:predicted nucleic acid-binding protein
MSLVVDSSVWIDLLRGAETERTALLRASFSSRRIVLGDLVYLEVMRGVVDASAAVVRQRMELYEMVAISNVAIARQAARNYAFLRARGVTVRRTIDMLIGTFCIANQMPLLHADRDFDALEQHLGLQVWRG